MDINDLLDMINNKSNSDSGDDANNEMEDQHETERMSKTKGQGERNANAGTERQEVNKENQIDPSAFKTVMDAVDGVKYNSIVQMEVKDFFDKNKHFAKEPTKTTILNTAFNLVKHGLSQGKTIAIGEALEKSSEYYKEQLVNHLQGGQDMLNQMAVKRKTGEDDFNEKIKTYTQDDFLREYDKEILPSMTVEGLNTVRIEKGYGRESEIIREGTAKGTKSQQTRA